MDHCFQFVALTLICAAAATSSCSPHGNAEPLDEPIRAMHRVAPVYPPKALEAGEEGRVVALVDVDSDGTPTQVALAKSSGSAALDEAALAAVRNWFFSPPRRNGDPVSTQVRVPIDFRINRNAPSPEPAEPTPPGEATPAATLPTQTPLEPVRFSTAAEPSAAPANRTVPTE